MTYRQDFCITLQQEVIVSQTAATVGQHQTLDYLPGSTLLGLAASRGYAHMTPELAWRVFHTGEVRFGDALPLTDARHPTWPVPLAWHIYKGDNSVCRDHGRLCFMAANLFDPSRVPAEHLDRQRQPKQLRRDYVSRWGDRVAVQTIQRMKTAIDPATGRAAENQLFGYRSLKAGQRFGFRLEADADLPEATFRQLIGWLQGEARLGRSRHAQYGRVNIEPVESRDWLPPRAPAERRLTLWLLSDLALQDDYGQPVLQPGAALLNLPAGSCWISDASFIRTRRYSPFNAKRQARDPERQVICRGSVLRYELPRPLTEPERDALTRLGLFQEAGLGLAAVDPRLLAHASPVFDVPDDSTAIHSVEGAKRPVRPDTPLLRYLQRQVAVYQQADEAAQQARNLYRLLCDCLEQARIWQGLVRGEPFEKAPGRSQWGQLKELSSQYRHDPRTLWQMMFEDQQAQIADRGGWNLQINPRQTLKTVFRQTLEAHAQKDYLPQLVGRLAALGLSEDWQRRLEGRQSLRAPAQTLEASHHDH